MAEFLSQMHFDELNACDPADVSKRTGAVYNAQTGCYELMVWNGFYSIDPKNGKIALQSGTGEHYNDYIHIFIINYMSRAKAVHPSGTWVSEKDLVGGSGFFRGPHLLPVQAICDRFGNDLDAFKTVCETLGGKPVDFADAAFSFEITPKIPVAVLYWLGDEDFPSEARMLFDKTIEAHLALDIVFAVAVEVCAALAKTYIHGA